MVVCMHNRIKAGVALFALLNLSVGICYSFSFDPLIAEFEPSGQESLSTFRVRNPDEEPIAIQIRIVERNVDLDGEENFEDVSFDFAVYPTQFVLQKKGLQ